MSSTVSHAGTTGSIRWQRAAGLSIVLGAMAFWAFWFSGLLWQDGGVIIGLGEVSWAIQLAIHGLTVLLLGSGLLAVAGSTTERRGLWLAAAIALPLGMVTIPPFLWVGIVLLAVQAWVVKHRVTAGLLLAGAVGLVTAYALGARVGTDGMPPLSSAQAAFYGVGVTATGLALVVMGLQIWSARTAAE